MFCSFVDNNTRLDTRMHSVCICFYYKTVPVLHWDTVDLANLYPAYIKYCCGHYGRL